MSDSSQPQAGRKQGYAKDDEQDQTSGCICERTLVVESVVVEQIIPMLVWAFTCAASTPQQEEHTLREDQIPALFLPVICRCFTDWSFEGRSSRPN